jgi:23S rRNA (cytosine1962-C5)-methyltransferase
VPRFHATTLFRLSGVSYPRNDYFDLSVLSTVHETPRQGVSYRSHVGRVTLKSGHVRPLFCGHPWVFQQAIAETQGSPQSGDEVSVFDPRGNLLGRGLWSSRSAIAVRMFTRNDVPIDGALLRARIERARALRVRLGLPSPETTAYRLVHGEGDGLPGLIVDVLGDVLVVQYGIAGMWRRHDLIQAILTSMFHPRAIIDRTTEKASKQEGFELGPTIAHGDPTLEELHFLERGIRYSVPLTLGQKTGFYVDQREIRARIATLARGKTVLDAYCYIGGFGLAAAKAGATDVLSVDESATAIATGALNARLNGLSEVMRFEKQDAIRAMEDASRTGGFDIVVCDPPKFSPTKQHRDAAINQYTRLARSACRATKLGGFLLFCSCSSAISADELLRAVAIGSSDVRMSTTLVERHIQGPDHPVLSAFPEGLYLKALLLRVDAVS